MKLSPLFLAFSLFSAGFSIAQELPAPEAASAEPSSKPNFSLPFSIPGLTGEDKEETAAESPGSSPSVAAAGPMAPGQGPGTPGSLPPGVKPDAAGEVEFVQRSNFVISKIRNNFRQLDPFGMPMDPTNPSEAPALATQYEEIEDVPVLTNSSLKNALATLPISGIYPKRNIIVIGARSFTRGDQFGMKLEELTIRLRFEGLRGQNIYFKDLDTQEVAAVNFNPTPKEFEPITSNTSAPQGNGIVPMKSLFIVN